MILKTIDNSKQKVSRKTVKEKLILFVLNKEKKFILLPHHTIIQPLPLPKTSCTKNVSIHRLNINV